MQGGSGIMGTGSPLAKRHISIPAAVPDLHLVLEIKPSQISRTAGTIIDPQPEPTQSRLVYYGEIYKGEKNGKTNQTTHH
jgi:hypothetical protein